MKMINSKEASEKKLIKNIQKAFEKAFRDAFQNIIGQDTNTFADPVLPERNKDEAD
jgi:DNA-binding ferritin-like protein (Dps family)